jgi:predicted nucleic acid-binding protein
MVSDEIFVIDSFAWIEYFMGSESGKIAKPYIENGNCVTPSIVIAELSSKYRREKVDFKDRLNFIRMKSRISVLNEEIAILAGRVYSERKEKVKNWGIVDSIILATADLLNARVVTGDEHFEDVERVIMIK